MEDATTTYLAHCLEQQQLTNSDSCSSVTSSSKCSTRRAANRRVLPPVPSTPPSLSPLRHLYRSARETLLRANPTLASTFNNLNSSCSSLYGNNAALQATSPSTLSSTQPFSPMKLQRRLESLAAAVHHQQQTHHQPIRQSSVDRVGYDFATNSDAANSPVPSMILMPQCNSILAGSLSPARNITGGLRLLENYEKVERESVHLRYLHSLLGTSRECVSRLEAGASRESLLAVDGSKGGRWSSPLSSGYQSQRSRDSFERPEESYNEYLELTGAAVVEDGLTSAAGTTSSNTTTTSNTATVVSGNTGGLRRRRRDAPPLEHLDSMDISDHQLSSFGLPSSQNQQPPLPPPRSPFEHDSPSLSREFTVGVLAILLADPRNLNLVFSPYCLQTVLAMLVPGAGGRTQDELLMALFEPPYESPLLMMGKFVAMNRRIVEGNAHCLLITSGVYVDERLKLEAAYVDLLRREFGVSAKAINFRDRTNACHLVNCDTNEATDGLIGEVLQPCHLQRCPPPVSPLPRMSSSSPAPPTPSSVVLISTALLRATWHPSYTFTRRQRPFFSAEYFFGGHRRKPPTPTSMLLQTAIHPFVHDTRLGIRAVQINLAAAPLAEGGDNEEEKTDRLYTSPADCKVAMVLFLADSEQTPLGSLLRGALSGDSLDYLLERLAPASVDLRFPEFHLDYTFEMVDQLRCLGMVDVFSGTRADLRPMLGSEMMNNQGYGEQKTTVAPAVTAVLQRVIVEVDLAGDGSPWVPPSGHMRGSHFDPTVHRFYADRPFLFALVTTDTPRKEVLFMGAINDPTV